MTALPPRYAEAIARLQASGDAWHAPLIRAAGQGRIRLGLVPRGARLPLRDLDDTAKPTLILLAGDDGTGPAPPEAWPQHKRLLRWCRAVLLHGAGGHPEHYAMAVDGAMQHKRLLLVECDSASLDAWISAVTRYAPRASALGIAPTTGPHPVEETRH